MKFDIKTALIPALVLVTAACASDEADTDEMAAADAADQTSVATMDSDDAYPKGGELNETAQSNYDNMDRQAASDEYDSNRDAEMQEMAAKTQSSSSESSDSEKSASAPMTMPKRSEMDFAYLDRNDDEKLSVAEYAVWALPVNPNAPAPNDAKKPYLTADEINEAGTTFFYFDEDGDTYLSESEFTAARTSSMT